MCADITLRTFTAEDYNEIQERGDTDNSGGVDYEEFRDLIYGLGNKKDIAERLGFETEEEMERFEAVFEDVDKLDLLVGNARISKQDLFNALDLDGNGELNAADLDVDNLEVVDDSEGNEVTVWRGTTNDFGQANKNFSSVESYLREILPPEMFDDPNATYSIEDLRSELSSNSYSHVLATIRGKDGVITSKDRDIALSLSDKAESNSGDLKTLFDLIDQSNSAPSDSASKKDGFVTREELNRFLSGDVSDKIAKAFGLDPDKPGDLEKIQELEHAVHTFEYNFNRNSSQIEVPEGEKEAPATADFSNFKDALTLSADDKKLIGKTPPNQNTDPELYKANQRFNEYFSREGEHSEDLLRQFMMGPDGLKNGDIFNQGGIKQEHIDQVYEVASLLDSDHENGRMQVTNDEGETETVFVWSTLMGIIDQKTFNSYTEGNLRYDENGEVVMASDNAISLEELKNYIDGTHTTDDPNFGSFDSLTDTQKIALRIIEDKLQQQFDEEFAKAQEDNPDLTEAEFMESHGGDIKLSRAQIGQTLSVSPTEKRYLEAAESLTSGGGVTQEEWAQVNSEAKPMSIDYFKDLANGDNATHDRSFVRSQLLKNLEDFDTDGDGLISLNDLKKTSSDGSETVFAPTLTAQRSSYSVPAFFTNPALVFGEKTVFEQLDTNGDKVLSKSELDKLRTDPALKQKMELQLTNENIDTIEDLIEHFDSIASNKNDAGVMGIALDEMELIPSALSSLGNPKKIELLYQRYAGEDGEFSLAELESIASDPQVQKFLSLPATDDTNNTQDAQILDAMIKDWAIYGRENSAGEVTLTQEAFEELRFTINSVINQQTSTGGRAFSSAQSWFRSGDISTEEFQHSKLDFILHRMLAERDGEGSEWGKMALNEDFPGIEIDNINISKEDFKKFFTEEGTNTSVYLNDKDLALTKLLYDNWDAVLADEGLVPGENVSNLDLLELFRKAGDAYNILGNTTLAGEFPPLHPDATSKETHEYNEELAESTAKLELFGLMTDGKPDKWAFVTDGLNNTLSRQEFYDKIVSNPLVTSNYKDYRAISAIYEDAGDNPSTTFNLNSIPSKVEEYVGYFDRLQAASINSSANISGPNGRSSSKLEEALDQFQENVFEATEENVEEFDEKSFKNFISYGFFNAEDREFLDGILKNWDSHADANGELSFDKLEDLVYTS